MVFKSVSRFRLIITLVHYREFLISKSKKNIKFQPSNTAKNNFFGVKEAMTEEYHICQTSFPWTGSLKISILSPNGRAGYHLIGPGYEYRQTYMERSN